MPGEPMALKDALHAAQHLADTSGSEVTVRLDSSTYSELPDDSPEPDGAFANPVSADLVVRPQAPRADAP